MPQLPAPFRSGRNWLIAAALVLLASAGGLWWRLHGEAPPRYLTAAVSRGPVTRVVTATGTVNPVLTIIVGSYVSGVIQQLFCDYNTEVKKGQVCARIDPRPYQSLVDQNQAQLDIAKAQLEKDRATLAYEKLNSERNASLAARNFASQDVADNARSLYEQAVAEVALDGATIALHQAELDAARVNLGYTDISSPVDGTVVSRNVTMGQTIAATLQTPTLFLIATDLTKMQVDTNVSESDIGAIRSGAAAHFSVDAFPGRVFTGTVTQVRLSPQAVQNVVTYDVVVSVDNSDLALKPGMTAATQIVIDERRDVLRVPSQALRYNPPEAVSETGPHLWLLRAARPVAVAVEPGLDDESFTELRGGAVQPGEAAIIGEQRGAVPRTGITPPRL